MKKIAVIALFILVPAAAQAESLQQGARDGYRTGSNIAGPVGGVLGGAVGGAVGGAIGGVKGVLGVPQSTHQRRYRRAG